MLLQLNPPSENCQLWLSPLKPELESASRQILDDEALCRYQAMKSQSAKTAYLTARWLAHHVLRSIDASINWQLAAEGPSRLLQPPANPFSISISHTDTHAAFALSKQGYIACDIESHRPRKNFLALAKRFFTPGEYRSLCLLPEQEGLEQFYRMWTVKEACLKARHRTVAGHLNDVALVVSTEGKQPFYHYHEDDAQGDHLFSGFMEQQLHVALCIEKDGAPDLAVTCLNKAGQPLRCDQSLQRLQAVTQQGQTR